MSEQDNVDQPEYDSAVSLNAIVEAIVFGAEEAIPAAKILEIINQTTGRDVGKNDVSDSIAWLNTEYERSGRSFRINEWAGGFRMATEPEYSEFLKALFYTQRIRRLSRSLMETLSIVAYKQPTTKPEVDHVRGVDSDYTLRRLLELNLVQISGRGEGVGHPLLYSTTTEFMDKFALKSMDDLPTLREVDDLLADPNFDRERAQLLFQEGLDLVVEDTDTGPTPISDPVEAAADAARAIVGQPSPDAPHSDGDGAAPGDIDLTMGNTSNGHSDASTP